MGAKTGYAHAILHALGLRQGQGHADGTHYLWCEPDAGVRLLLHAYTDRELAQAAARIIRSWRDEDPRALWERLRAEGPAVCPDGGMYAWEVARWAVSHALTGMSGGYDSASERAARGERWGGDVRDFIPRRMLLVEALPATITPDAREVDPREVARLLYMAPVPTRPDSVDAWNADPKFGGDDLPGRGTVPDVAHKVIIQQSATMPLADLSGPVGDLVADVDRLGGPCEILGPVVIAAPVEVAGHHSRRAGPVKRGTHQSADAPVNAPSSGAHDEFLIPVFAEPTNQGPVGVDGLDLPHVADHVLGSLSDDAPFLSHMDTSTTTISYGGASIQLPPGTICYMDPSYVGTTGYADNLGRAEVVALARRWAAAGAVVCISEAEPIPELVADGWHSVDITETRKGQKRTFSKQQREWLTMSEAPRWRPSVARDLFGNR